MVVLYDSLQLAHKCILNSFYGYVMRKGARWSSMEMAGIVTHTGANIIKEARELVERVGIPLELDTDGIWCMLPQSFPENFEFKLSGGQKYVINYPCVVLNKLVDDRFSNEQYHSLSGEQETTGADGQNKYTVSRECTIFFEVDGPYRAMVLPASTEEGKKLKKRYAVFNHDGTLAELKGFELKRRGELKLIKIFQGQVFEHFLRGNSLEECYAAVARVAKHWLGVLQTQGSTMEPDELLELISSSSSMSRRLADYGAQKSLAITTARRLAEFLGDEMVKDKGLACKYIVSRYPSGAPKTDRAVPVAIFKASAETRHYYLRKWSQKPSLPADAGLSEIVDWAYYIERLGSTIQKIITIPAALQHVRDNPVPDVAHPSWLAKRLCDAGRQTRINFARLTAPLDIEELASASANRALRVGGVSHPVPRVTKTRRAEHDPDEDRALLAQPRPDPHTHYTAWLHWSKAQWREQRRARANRDVSGAGASQGHIGKRVRRRAPTRGTLGALLHDHHRQLRTSFWEILEIAEQVGRPGVLRVWVLLLPERGVDEDGAAVALPRVLSVDVVVPRVIHLNCTHDDRLSQLPNAVKEEKLLPRGAPTLQLYAVTFDEGLYERRQRQLQALFTHPSMHGVYETGVSPILRSLIHLQSRCQITRAARADENVRFVRCGVCTHLCVCMHVYARECTCVCVCVCVCVCTHCCTYVCVCVCERTCVCGFSRV
jgi:DNA polymerase epsilon subunit 1